MYRRLVILAIGFKHFSRKSSRANVSRLVASPRRISGDLDQVAACGTPYVAAGEDEATFAFVEHLHAARVVAEVKGNPALAGLVGVGSVRHAIQDVLDFARCHADLQPGELAGGSGYTHDLAGIAAVSGFDDANVAIG